MQPTKDKFWFRVTDEEAVVLTKMLESMQGDYDSDKIKKLVFLGIETLSQVKPQQTQDSSPVPNYDGFMKPSQTEIAYLCQKERERAKTEGMIERAKAREELKRQFEGERAEIEYADWKRKQDERERTRRPRPVHVDFPNSAMFSDNEGWT